MHAQLSSEARGPYFTNVPTLCVPAVKALVRMCRLICHFQACLCWKYQDLMIKWLVHVSFFSKLCTSSLAGFWRIQLTRMHTVYHATCKDNARTGIICTGLKRHGKSAGQGVSRTATSWTSIPHISFYIMQLSLYFGSEWMGWTPFFRVLQCCTDSDITLSRSHPICIILGWGWNPEWWIQWVWIY